MTTAPPSGGPRTWATYLGLGVDEQDPVAIDGDEDDVRVGGLRALLRRARWSQPHWEARGHLPESPACTHTCAHMPLQPSVCLRQAQAAGLEPGGAQLGGGPTFTSKKADPKVGHRQIHFRKATLASSTVLSWCLSQASRMLWKR